MINYITTKIKDYKENNETSERSVRSNMIQIYNSIPLAIDYVQHKITQEELISKVKIKGILLGEKQRKLSSGN